MSLLDFCLYVGDIFSVSVEFRDILGKFIIKSREFLLCDGVELAFEYCRFSGEILRMVLFRECYVDVKFVADLVTCDLFLKSRYERS